ncbi:MAG: SufD family Fe-S cluster assembly protein [Verrucomicrobiales bacterium]|nr:SufD family Fe-S cluster assembly protein [Verrucomicrobiales bacterium]
MSTTLSKAESETKPEQAVPWFAAPPVHDIALDLPTWYTEHQSESWDRFLDLPDPVRKDENWRFADLRKVRFSELVAARPVDNVETLVQRAKKERVEHFAAHYVFANNRLVYSEVADLPDGAVCLPINEALVQHGDLVKEHFMKEGETLGGEKFSALHGAATLSGLFIQVPRGCVIEKPVLIHHFSGGDFQAVFPHTLITANENAQVSVMEFFESVGDSEQNLVIGQVDLVADQGGNIQYVSLQDLSDLGPKHVQINSSRAGRDAKIKSAFVNLGASWVRNESINRMQGTGSDCQIYSANLANGSQEYDQRTLQSHEAQHTTSDLLFKNALYDDARTIFSGLIQVQPGSHYTDSYQTCRNLLGSETAEANAMPGLEIDADQVKCSHGSTSGQISDEEIFYLQARGIPAEDARKMISLGFMNESISQLTGDEIKAHLFDRVARKFRGLDQ